MGDVNTLPHHKRSRQELHTDNTSWEHFWPQSPCKTNGSVPNRQLQVTWTISKHTQPAAVLKVLFSKLCRLWAEWFYVSMVSSRSMNKNIELWRSSCGWWRCLGTIILCVLSAGRHGYRLKSGQRVPQVEKGEGQREGEGGDMLTKFTPEIMLDTTDWAERPTTTPLTPPTVNRGWMLIPRTWRHIRAPLITAIHEVKPLIGSTILSSALSYRIDPDLVFTLNLHTVSDGAKFCWLNAWYDCTVAQKGPSIQERTSTRYGLLVRRWQDFWSIPLNSGFVQLCYPRQHNDMSSSHSAIHMYMQYRYYPCPVQIPHGIPAFSLDWSIGASYVRCQNNSCMGC